jgi:ankyrin repeat protein
MWTLLMRAVALGSVDDVRSQIEKSDDLAARDRWERTAWLLSIQTGEVAKAELLLHAGAEKTVRGRCGKTPFTFTIANGHATMLRWLLDQGLDPNETDGGANAYQARVYFEQERLGGGAVWCFDRFGMSINEPPVLSALSAHK